MSRIILLIHCPDSPGIIANVTSYFYGREGNIVYIDQYVDTENSVFFMRLECEFTDDTDINKIKVDFGNTIAEKYRMTWHIYSGDRHQRMALFVSKYEHCLYDLLGRYKSGELQVEIPVIISNHPDLAPIAESFGIPFHHIPVEKGKKEEAEARQLEILEKERIDFAVLARYMQIVSEKMIDKFQNKIINIHHSFLPAFAGAKPYHSAYKRGVKIIGATSHYVTEELDAGPIIEQDIARISHSHSVKDLILKGRDLEKMVLARGVKLHTERKTLVYNNKTIIFS